MNDADRFKLLHGPYKAPRLGRGDHAFCHVRDYPVVIIGWSDARIAWPVCRPLDPPRCGRGLLIDDELTRAIRHEAATAVAHWWGVHLSTVLHWRKALGVTRTNNEGSHRLVLGAISASLESRFGEGPATKARAAVWTAEEVALVGALPDAEVARRTGRTTSAVVKKRAQLGRPAVTCRGVGFEKKFWTAEEDQAARSLPPPEAARRTGRSMKAVLKRRRLLASRPNA